MAADPSIQDSNEPRWVTSPNESDLVHMETFSTVQQREDSVYTMLVSLPSSSLARLQRRIVPLLQRDVVGLLPTEVALHILSFLPWKSLLHCSRVSRRWRALAEDPVLWRRLCEKKNWTWKVPSLAHDVPAPDAFQLGMDDEGMGDEEDALPFDGFDGDSGFVSMRVSDDADDADSSDGTPLAGPSQLPAPPARPTPHSRHTAPASLSSLAPHEPQPRTPDYKQLYTTHIRIYYRIRHGLYQLSTLQAPTAAPHRNTIYCLQLYVHPGSSVQTLFTGSKDQSVKEWCLETDVLVREITGVHDGSILSLCVHGGYLASAGSDRSVAVWDLERDKLVCMLRDHEDSVLCVRFNDRKLVSCSKDRKVRVYSWPDLKPQHELVGHRAAINAIAISDTFVVSASGDRSIRLWDIETGQLLRVYENHHNRGIACVDFEFPYVVTGSSDRNIRLFDLLLSKSWCTAPQFDSDTVGPPRTTDAFIADEEEDFDNPPLVVCDSCGSAVASDVRAPASSPPPVAERKPRHYSAHGDLVRSVGMGDNFVVSGSYDTSVKVWDRKTGQLVTELVGGHTGRVFCTASDPTKIVTCGEDLRICIWDFAYGLDTSCIKL
ncbi:WD40 repeat-like protein [Dentipellis sp. KUC8613]|nr:WD40 repeat-like protein [Dentipellis sp. KUC8613]